MYSRLANHDRRTLLRQTIFFSAGSVALVIAFLFVILPAFIKFLAFRNLSSKIAVTDDAVLATRPSLSSPYEATSSSSITLTGRSQGDRKIILLQNGVPGPETSANDEGDFSFENVSLESGSNTFTAVSENEKGERGNPSSPVNISYVKDAPKLEISEPANDATISQRKQNPVVIKGKTDPGNRIYINEKLQFVSSDGSFSGQFQLTEGDNTITVKAVNPASIETIQELSVRFQP